jgi:hypothetical protein
MLLIGVVAVLRQTASITGCDSHTASADVSLNPPPLLSWMMLPAGGSLATDGISGLVAMSC